MNEADREIGIRGGSCGDVRDCRGISQNIDRSVQPCDREVLVVVGNGCAQQKIDQPGTNRCRDADRQEPVQQYFEKAFHVGAVSKSFSIKDAQEDHRNEIGEKTECDSRTHRILEDIQPVSFSASRQISTPDRTRDNARDYQHDFASVLAFLLCRCVPPRPAASPTAQVTKMRASSVQSPKRA